MNSLLNEFSSYCDEIIKEKRPVLDYGAGSISKMNHKRSVIKLVPRIESDMRNKADELLSSFDGDSDKAKEEIKKIANQKISLFING